MGIIEFYEESEQKSPCIYWIINMENVRLYIGQTTNASKRYRQHLYMLNKNKHYNKTMQNDYNSGHRLGFAPVYYGNALIPVKSLREQELELMLWGINHGFDLYNSETKEQIIYLLNRERSKRRNDIYSEMYDKRDRFYEKYTNKNFPNFINSCRIKEKETKELTNMQKNINKEIHEKAVSQLSYEISKEIEVEIESFVKHLEKRVYEIVSLKCKKIL